MKKEVLVFGVTHWRNREEAQRKCDQLEEWMKMLFNNGFSSVFVTTGTHSNPSFIPEDSLFHEGKLIQNGVKYTKQYNVDWNYFRNGFMTGVWYFLLNNVNEDEDEQYDILFHIQPRTKIRPGAVNFKDLIKEFRKSDALIMAPKLTYDYGVHVEISFMAMKREAVMLYATSGLRGSLSLVPLGAFNCEAEAEHLFYNRWFNPWPGIRSIRKFPMVRRENCEYNLTDEEFLNYLSLQQEKITVMKRMLKDG